MAKRDVKKTALAALVRRVISESNDYGMPEEDELVRAYTGTEYADELLQELREKSLLHV